MPREDGIEHVPRSYIFGFESFASFREWFPPIKANYENMSQAGLHLAVYSVRGKTTVRRGKNQVCFSRRMSKKIGILPLDILA